MDIILRKETISDYRTVEELTREAFWNLYIPGCSEHYLAHVMRQHEDFIPDLDYLASVDGKIVGNIMYTRSCVVDENRETMATLTFGPVSVLPDYQRMGIGSRLIEKTVGDAKARKEKAIIIYGSPKNYCKFGFKSSKDFNISTMDGKYPYGLLVLELEEGAFKGHKWKYRESEVYNVKTSEAEEFDKGFMYKGKGYRYTQEEFSISCRAIVE